jgi:hypothetical protein
MFVCLQAASFSLRAQQDGPGTIQKSCQDFVQAFYDWYAPIALKEHSGPAWNLALEYKSNSFASDISRHLKKDSAAQAKNAGEIVGLDFDPFLNNQDSDERYVVGNVAVKGDSYWADVYAVRSGEKNAKPDIVAELMRKSGRWLFVNFHYGKSAYSNDENLVSILKALTTVGKNTPSEPASHASTRSTLNLDLAIGGATLMPPSRVESGHWQCARSPFSACGS